MLLKTDDLGIPRFTNRGLIDLIYSGNIEKCHVVLCDETVDIEQFNTAMEEQGFPKLQKYIPLDVDQKTFDGVCQSEWFMPDEYKTLDVDDWCMRKLMKMKNTIHPNNIIFSEDWKRVQEELEAFDERDMYNLLRYMIYLVDFMRENDIVWGVGRGSSVASYVLYLIGVHRINSIKYNLDWREFLRD
jgi:DNA polymerase III alpha subunit